MNTYTANMILRSITEHDLFIAEQIHKKWYAHEFVMPDLLQLQTGFTVEIEERPVIIGGIKAIAEIVLLTDKDFPVEARREGLYKSLEASLYMSRQLGYDQIHCSVQDINWERHLKKAGFRNIKGTLLVRDV